MTRDDLETARRLFMEQASKAPNLPPVRARRGQPPTYPKGSRGHWLSVIDEIDFLITRTPERPYVPD